MQPNDVTFSTQQTSYLNRFSKPIEHYLQEVFCQGNKVAFNLKFCTRVRNKVKIFSDKQKN